MRVTGLFALVLVLVVGASWITNLIKLSDCDFEAPVKCEVIHLAGLFPPVAVVTAWLPSDKN